MGYVDITVAEYRSATGPFSPDDLVTIRDTGENLETLTIAEISALAAQNVDALDSTVGEFSLSIAKFNALGSVSLTYHDFLILRDTGSDLANLTAEQYAAAKAKGVDQVDASDDVLTMRAAQALALKASGLFLSSSDFTTLVDSASAIEALSATQMAQLASSGYKMFDSLDDVLTLTKAQADAALGGTGLSLSVGDDVVISDTAQVLSGLVSTVIATYAAKGVDAIAPQSELTLNVGQAAAFAESNIVFAGPETVTLFDAGYHIAGLVSAAQIAALAAKGLDAIDSSTEELTLTRARFDALGAVALDMADEVTLLDTKDTIEALTDAQIGTLANAGIDVIAAYAAVTFDVAKILSFADNQIRVYVAGPGWVTVKDTGANIAALSPDEIAELGPTGVIFLEPTSDLAMSANQAAALLASGSIVRNSSAFTLKDSGADIVTLKAPELARLAAVGLDLIDAEDDVLVLDAATVAALPLYGVSLSNTDVVTLSDTGVALKRLAYWQISEAAEMGVAFINATDDQIAFTIREYDALGQIVLNTDDKVSLTDTGASLAELAVDRLKAMVAKGIDILDASDNSITFTAARLSAFTSIPVSFSPADTVSLTDNGSTIGALAIGEIAAFAAKGLDMIDVSDDRLAFTSAQLAALDKVDLAAGDVLTVTGTAVADYITGKSAKDTLYGLFGNDRLSGALGDDRLYGGAGKDILTGNEGRDIFVFNSKLNKKANLDKITDFNVRDDAIWLDNAVFKKLGKKGSETKPLKLNKKFFTVGDVAKDKDDYIVYNKKKGVLLYDADGNGSGNAIEIATMAKKLKISALDFFLV